MKSIFFTKPKEVTLSCLRFLVEQGEELLGVILYDKQRYDGSAFILYCQEHGVPVFDFSETEDVFLQHKNEIDMIYCKTFPKRIKKSWIQSAKIAALNFHSAPLPEYQGVFGYNFAFLNQEKEYGVSCHYLTAEFDEGNLIDVVRFPYDFSTGNVRELVQISDEYLLGLFQKTYLRFKEGETVSGTKQTTGAYYSRADFDKAKQVFLQDSDDDILRKIRAFWCPPFDGAYMMIGNQKVYLLTEENYQELCNKGEGNRK